ncbi:MAG: PKD domain-containing protein [Candidatus Bipolaricaulota bacterium]|nr:MAG: PKD domain-containing protein [Candidatus Bipolaricaulota bacterium]
MKRGHGTLVVVALLAVVVLTGCALLNRPPLASFSASPITGEAPLEVRFDATASSDPDGGLLTFTWSFGDGQSGFGDVVAHTYSSTGQFTAELTVVDEHGAQATSYQTILVTDLGGLPVAQFTASPSSGGYPLSVAFNAASSSDSDGEIAAYHWTFGDGSTATGMNAVHTYNAIGTYTATLTVIDDSGNSATRNVIINVTESGGGVCG